jgi:hypothetical protein
VQTNHTHIDVINFKKKMTSMDEEIFQRGNSSRHCFNVTPVPSAGSLGRHCHTNEMQQYRFLLKWTLLKLTDFISMLISFASSESHIVQLDGIYDGKFEQDGG